MLINTHAVPDFVIVDPHRLLPRFWATAWSLSISGQSLSVNTRKMRLRHVDAFYLFCDEHFGTDAFDSALSLHDAVKTQHMVEMFYAALTADPNYTTTAVQRWDTVRSFVQMMARRLAPQSDAWSALSSLLRGMGAIRSPKRGRFKFIRALPTKTLADLFEVAEPGTARNPFKGKAVQWRNWLIFNLLIMCGLRRGEPLRSPPQVFRQLQALRR